MYARWAIVKASRAFCSTIAIETPAWLTVTMFSNRISAAIGDNPADGSSSNSTFGSTISAIAMASI